MDETELGKFMLVSPVQPKKAKLLMVMTELGILMLVISKQLWNALWPIVVMELGIIVFLQPVIKVLEAVSMMALQLFRES